MEYENAIFNTKDAFLSSFHTCSQSLRTGKIVAALIFVLLQQLTKVADSCNQMPRESTVLVLKVWTHCNLGLPVGKLDSSKSAVYQNR